VPAWTEDYPTRAVKSSCVIRSETATEVACEYEVTLARDDPLIGSLLTGEARVDDPSYPLMQYLAGAEYYWNFSQPTLTYDWSKSDSAVLRAAAWGTAGMRELSDQGVVAEIADFRLSVPDPSTFSEQWILHSDRMVFAGVGGATPTRMDSHDMVIEAHSGMGHLAVALRPPTASATKETNIDRQLSASKSIFPPAVTSGFFGLITVLVPWLILAAVTRSVIHPYGVIARHASRAVLALAAVGGGWVLAADSNSVMREAWWWPDLPAALSSPRPGATAAVLAAVVPSAFVAAVRGSGQRPLVTRRHRMLLAALTTVVVLVAALLVAPPIRPRAIPHGRGLITVRCYVRANQVK
jgi:hypothetical protein